MREEDFSKIAIYLVFAWFALVLLVLLGLFVEAFLDMPNAPEWASAIGGFLAVLAAALIAIAQSKQNKRTIEAQAELQERALVQQRELQNQLLAYQRDQAEAETRRARLAALGVLKAAHSQMSSVVRMAGAQIEGPDDNFIKTWAPNAETAISLVQGVQYSHLYHAEHIDVATKVQIFFKDAWRLVQNAIEDGVGDDVRYYNRGIAKSKVNHARFWIGVVDPEWRETVALLENTVEENEATERLRERWAAQ